MRGRGFLRELDPLSLVVFLVWNPFVCFSPGSRPSVSTAQTDGPVFALLAPRTFSPSLSPFPSDSFYLFFERRVFVVCPPPPLFLFSCLLLVSFFVVLFLR